MTTASADSVRSNTTDNNDSNSSTSDSSTPIVNRQRLLWLLLLSGLGAGVVIALCWGPVAISPSQVFDSLWSLLHGDAIAGSNDWVVRELRLPRVLLALLVGAGLAVAGVVTQGVFRNPLADPGLIGVASGAALAAVAVIVLSDSILFFWADLTGPLALPLAAFGGGLLVTWVMYRLGTWRGETQVAMLLLAGVAINVLTGAATGVLTYLADDQQLRSMTFWSMGSLAYGRWPEVMAMSLFILLPVLLCLRYGRALNAMLLGEQVAGHLGLDVQRCKRWLLAAAALMVGAGVAVAGIIGFIGLVVPHLLRLIIGPDHRLLLPMSALAGGLLLLVADTLARNVIAPQDLPVGLLMALIGGPLFLSMLLHQVRGRMG
ncbi:FecCD family ABC transporter permease [Oceanobacter kriegii]|uniref:FecCD family ABC transporter permease n=1 Tax=Oceanobacter kriegii TaxID=64972 RepID=UPI0004056775|nr:iron ABC transporter permease [Oceanobacter kriegii]